MKLKPRPEASQLNLFQAQFDQLLNLDHPLCVLAPSSRIRLHSSSRSRRLTAPVGSKSRVNVAPAFSASTISRTSPL